MNTLANFAIVALAFVGALTIASIGVIALPSWAYAAGDR